ncbi:hypothetical protein IZ6_25710 [Terrihabitans soli]|uniref:Tyr recombinase domain-containing protein n=1 Tax=Terrihabitans soli TaxID=708113 RepID=A0A6S6QQK5_9HYPH|nr:hypothetical protein IZ6_25710 [Terrihabitans soli]
MAELYKRSRSPYFQARLRIGDKIERVSTGQRTRGEAQTWADNEEAKRNFLIVNAEDLTLIEASEKFFAERTDLKPTTVALYKGNLVNILRILGDFPMKTLDEDRLGHYVQSRKDMRTTRGPAIRKDLAFLSTLYTHARHWPGGPKTNPLKEFSRKGIPDSKKDKTWLRPQEFERLLSVCRHEYQRLFVTLAVHTGLRKSELFKLRWDQIDMDERLITIGNIDVNETKSGKSRMVPLSDVAFDTLRRTPRAQREGWVFLNRATGKPYTTLKKFWLRARRDAKLTGVKIHHMRHTFASWNAMRGVREKVIQDMLGHSTSSMTHRYAHTSIDELFAAAKVFSANTLGAHRAPDSAEEQEEGTEESVDFSEGKDGAALPAKAADPQIHNLVL